MPGARTAEDIYRDYVVAHGLERRALLGLLRDRFGESAAVLYPGCFVHVTPSFFFQHVVYVDRGDLPRDFFADAGGVERLISANRCYRRRPYLKLLARDFTAPLEAAERSFDLLLALYAGGISRACWRYLGKGGVLVSNDHQGDAREAAALGTLRLVAVVKEERGRVRYLDDALDGYLEPAPPPSRRAAATRRRYLRTAEYYVFRRLESAAP